MLKKQDELLVSATEKEHLIFVSKTVKVQLCVFFQKCDWLMAEVNNDGSLRCTSPSFCRLVPPSAWTVTCYDVSLRSHNS